MLMPGLRKHNHQYGRPLARRIPAFPAATRLPAIDRWMFRHWDNLLALNRRL